MSKELEQFNKLVAIIKHYVPYPECINDYIKNVESALKVLEIIKNKQVSAYWLWLSDNVEKYNEFMDKMFVDTQKVKLIPKEYELLKEILL